MLHGEDTGVVLGLGTVYTGWLLTSQNQEVNCEIWCLSATSQKMVTQLISYAANVLNLIYLFMNIRSVVVKGCLMLEKIPATK